jgi:hypothetical protein
MKLSRCFLTIVLAVSARPHSLRAATDRLAASGHRHAAASRVLQEGIHPGPLHAGVSVHRYRFLDPWQYDPEALTEVKEAYHSPAGNS